MLAEQVTVELDTAAGIDVAAERRRLDKDLQAARKEAEQTERKLANDSFLAKAPPEVVAKTRDRLAAATADIERISGRLQDLLARGDGMTTAPGGPPSIEDELREAEREILTRRPEHAIEPTLDRIADLVSLLGDPQRAYPVIHVTGTNGKTSTARMIESLLRARGLRTGLFTSPHLSSIRERIALDGEPVSAEQFVAAYEETGPLRGPGGRAAAGPLSFFEVLTAMAFAIFADRPVDVAIIEVGLGGTWDSTNVADGAVAVVTPISLDHTRWLGDTVEQIAGEKAGIIKPGAVAVLAQQPVPAAEVLLRRAVSVGASVLREGIEFGVLDRDLAVGGQRLDLRGLRGDYTDIAAALVRRLPGQQRGGRAGRCRGVRPGAAVRPGRGRRVRAARPGASCATGSRRCTSPGRLEVVRRSPVVVVDSAHNPAGMAAAMEALTEAFTFAVGDRRAGGQRGQGCAGDSRSARAGGRRAGGDPELIGPVDGSSQAGRAGGQCVRAGAGTRGRAAG